MKALFGGKSRDAKENCVPLPSFLQGRVRLPECAGAGHGGVRTSALTPNPNSFFKHPHVSTAAAEQDAEICGILSTPVDESNCDPASDEEPELLTNNCELMAAFINDSPYSFGHPLFYTTPRRVSSGHSQFVPVKSRRALFAEPSAVNVKEDKPATQARNQHEPQDHVEAPSGSHIVPTIIPAVLKGLSESSDRSNKCVSVHTDTNDKTQRLAAAVKRLRAALAVDSPYIKETYRRCADLIHAKEKANWPETVKATLRALVELPRMAQWKLVVELADSARRVGRFSAARSLHRVLSYLQPFYAQAWVDAAKMYDDCGDLTEAAKMLRVGLQFSPLDESMFAKLLKYYEKLELPSEARQLLSELSSSCIVLKSPKGCEVNSASAGLVAQAALFEAREGHGEKAALALQHVEAMLSDPANVYFEYAKQEERLGNLENAKALCQKSLILCYSFHVALFLLLRIAEKQELTSGSCTPTSHYSQVLARSWKQIPREMLWRLHVEVGLTLARQGKSPDSRTHLAQGVLQCPDNVRWKLWVTAAREEARMGDFDSALKLLGRSATEAPFKQQGFILLECARLHELAFCRSGKAEWLTAAQKLHTTARTAHGLDWRTHLETVSFEMRQGKLQPAEDLLKASLQVHSTTGRLWAVLVQVQHARDPSGRTAHATLLKAISQTPKSGEVWCEAAKLHLSPFSDFFDLRKARTCLEFAIRFTPQYGDSFVEMARLCLLEKTFGLSNAEAEVEVEAKYAHTLRQCKLADPNYGLVWSFYRTSLLDSAHDIIVHAVRDLERELPLYAPLLLKRTQGQRLDSGCRFSPAAWAGSETVGRLLLAPQSRSHDEHYRLVYGYEQIIS